MLFAGLLENFGSEVLAGGGRSDLSSSAGMRMRLVKIK